MTIQKPHLTLLHGRDALKPEALAEFYARLKGVEVTPDLVERFRCGLAERREKTEAED